ncbi:MAG: hypothetical protein D6744_06475 [Planctomycetota bacterium]|nr:MAG: hypothetical protein D6744_06475 [Planctomycetota bacterium]
MFNHDWFHNGGLQRMIEEARRRCAAHKFPDADRNGNGDAELRSYLDALETRTILYMKDGLTYEVHEILDIGNTAALAFECVPVDENYRVGSIVIVAPYDDIARVEVFAVHPDDKPQEQFRIHGFRASDETARPEPHA